MIWREFVCWKACRRAGSRPVDPSCHPDVAERPRSPPFNAGLCSMVQYPHRENIFGVALRLYSSFLKQVQRQESSNNYFVFIKILNPTTSFRGSQVNLGDRYLKLGRPGTWRIEPAITVAVAVAVVNCILSESRDTSPPYRELASTICVFTGCAFLLQHPLTSPAPSISTKLEAPAFKRLTDPQ